MSRMISFWVLLCFAFVPSICGEEIPAEDSSFSAVCLRSVSHITALQKPNSAASMSLDTSLSFSDVCLRSVAGISKDTTSSVVIHSFTDICLSSVAGKVKDTSASNLSTTKGK